MAFASGHRAFPRRAPRGLGAVACLAVLLWGLAACGGGEEAEPAYRVPSLTLGDLHRCKEGPGPTSLRCGAISVPFEREDPSLGNTRVGFTVLPREQRQRPSRGTIFAVEGGPGYASSWTVRSFVLLFGSLLQRRELVMVDMRGTGRSHAAGLSRPPVRAGAALDRAPHLRGTTRPAVQLLPHLRRRGRHQRRPAGAGPGPDHPLRRLLRHLSGPVLRLPPPRDTQRPGAGRGLPDPRRERLVSEPDRDRRPLDLDRLPALARLLREREQAPATGWSTSCAPGTRGSGPLIDVLSVAAYWGPRQLPADRQRREASSSTATLTPGRC